MTSLKGVDPYAVAEERLAALFARERDPQALHAGVCRILSEAVPTYTWVGVYERKDGDLVLTHWHGSQGNKRATIAIPIGDERAGAGALVVVSEHRAAFGPADRALLEEIAARLTAQGFKA